MLKCAFRGAAVACTSEAVEAFEREISVEKVEEYAARRDSEEAAAADAAAAKAEAEAI